MCAVSFAEHNGLVAHSDDAETTMLSFDEVVAAAGVTDVVAFAGDLRSVCGIEPATARFSLRRMPLERLAGWVCQPESYLQDNDVCGHRRAVELADAYRCGRRVPPIVFGWLVVDSESLQVLDGLHRLAGAGAAGLRHIEAFEAHQ